jgi:hypothetical protein
VLRGPPLQVGATVVGEQSPESKAQAALLHQWSHQPLPRIPETQRGWQLAGGAVVGTPQVSW